MGIALLHGGRLAAASIFTQESVRSGKVLDQLECPKQYYRLSAHHVVVPSCNSAVESVLQETRRRLGSLGYVELQRLQFDYQDGVLVLQGRVSSHFLKQLAQECVRSQPEVEMLINRTVVVPNSRSDRYFD
jgi:hypothetical protein